jgi:hypothetical protein
MYLRKFICQVGLIKLGEKKKIKGHQFGRGTIKKKTSHELSNAHMVADNFRWASIGNNKLVASMCYGWFNFQLCWIMWVGDKMSTPISARLNNLIDYR